MEQALHLQPVLILLVVGILSIAIMRPLHMSPIVGYLIAGMLIGGHGLGLIEESGTTGMQAVVQHSYPRGLDMAAVVLEQYQVSKKRINKWMQRQQMQELEDVPA